jgi:gamma-glutamylcyclotransferase
MNHAQMQECCPGGKFLFPARLDDYTFVYDGRSTVPAHIKKGAVANIIPQKGSHVWGALYEVTSENITTLDMLEDIPNAYQKYENVVVHDGEGNFFENVLVYRRSPQMLGEPTSAYKDTILRGAEDSGLPKEYVDLLK